MNEEIYRMGDIAAPVFFICELIFFVFLMSLFPNLVLAVVGEDNVTVRTTLDVGDIYPEVINVTINGGSTVDLTANSTTTVSVLAIVRDFNGQDDIINVSAELFDNAASSYGGTDDNNNHYTNSTCTIDTSYGNAFEANATCIFQVWYYANNATWNATVLVIDNTSRNDTNSDIETINSLLALGLPDTIDYGTVNSTEVSPERTANITNFGNVFFNLSLTGYGASPGDGLAMNCTVGISNISIEYERYNLSVSNISTLNLTQFQNQYLNLSNLTVVRTLNVPQRVNDTAAYIGDTNSSYWRIYVPIGAAGSCSGNIIFGAVQSAGS